MRAAITRNGLMLRVIAGTHSAILGIDLQENKRKGCLGFSIQRTDLGTVEKPIPPNKQAGRWLPNMLGFPGEPAGTTETAPLQKFRWGDYTLQPASRYRFKVVPKYGKPGKLTTPPELADGVEVEIATEDPAAHEAAVYFNRAAAASSAFEKQFPHLKTETLLLGKTDEARKARAWLSNGLEEALLGFLAQAADKSFALHGAIYEFQKPELLAGLKAAADRARRFRSPTTTARRTPRTRPPTRTTRRSRRPSLGMASNSWPARQTRKTRSCTTSSSSCSRRMARNSCRKRSGPDQRTGPTGGCTDS